MKIVYLDQNKWIELSREEHGLDPSHRNASTLSTVRDAVDQGNACFPLSMAHYQETHAQSNPKRRLRLARFMLSVSRDQTLAPFSVIVEHEIEEALSKHFPGRVTVRPLRLLGSGLRHTCAHPLPPPLVVKVRDGADVDPASVAALQARVDDYSSLALLSGADPLGGEEERPRFDLSVHQERFRRHLESFGPTLKTLDGPAAERSYYAVEMNDILDPLNRVLGRNGIAFGELEHLGVEGLKQFVEDMPTRRVSMHLHRQWAKNKDLKTKRSDLNDWGLLGVAAAYCDIVVTEKQFADLINRDGFRERGLVISALERLPALLS